MKRWGGLAGWKMGVYLGLFGFLVALAGCAAPADVIVTPSAPVAPAATVESASPPTTQAPAAPAAATATATLPEPTATAPTVEESLAERYPLSELGPYYVGTVALTLVDERRAGREISVVLWYPALKEEDSYGRVIRRNARPDPSGAPYPLILTEANSGGTIFGDHLATHGFVMAQITIPDHMQYEHWDISMLSWPQDFVFTLEQLAANPPETLVGVIDVENAGATGYSYGGDIALTLSGVRIDPQAYLEYCANPPEIDAGRGVQYYREMTCSLAGKWDEFEAYAQAAGLIGEERLWKPVTDPRLRAVLPMASSGAWLYGAEGLAAADRPVLMIAMTEDDFSPYEFETQFIYDHLGGPEHSMIALVGRTHMSIVESQVTDRLKHFVTAYFGWKLQGKEDYRKFLGEGIQLDE